jgi:hypothetical protein
MASNLRRTLEILSRLRHPSEWFRPELKEALWALSYTTALLGLFWFMNKVAIYHHFTHGGVTGSVLPK